ncbi:MAG: winged helix-turn-helix domain-containing protein [Candidatus Microthrix parvicella]|nr:hypothetical protein [Acidimicrobiia bacterium]
MNDVKLPSSADLMAPTLLALKGLGGSASREELYQSILETPVFAEASVGRPEDGSFEEQARRRVGFSLSKLKKLKAVDNVEWGHWTLTDTGREFLQLPTCEAELRHLDHESRVGKRPDKLLERVQSSGENGTAMTVRDLLSHWGVRRRGSEVVTRIQRDLAEHNLETLPRFDQVAIDDEILVRLSTGVSPSTDEALPEPVSATPKEPSPIPDQTPEAGIGHPEQADFQRPPQVTIGNLPSAGSGLARVTPHNTVLEAVSVMESNNYSQLAVGSSDHNLSGSISWTDIGRASHYGLATDLVKDVMAPDPPVANWNSPLLGQVRGIVDRGFVFVRNPHNEFTGIVTSSDLSGQFLDLAKPFLLIGEIEGWIRATLDAAFDADELAGATSSARVPDDTESDQAEREVEGARDLTFGEYIRWIERPANWERIGWNVDRSLFCKHLHEVREVRNDVMHFSPDPIDVASIVRVEELLRWLRRLSATRGST